MDCERAKQLIDLKVDAMVGPTGTAPGGMAKPGAAEGGERRRHVLPERLTESFAELDAHLATCPTCAADYRELLRTRELLADLAAETPTEQEMNKMLTKLQSTGRPTASREGEAGWPNSSEVGDTKIQPTRTRRAFVGPLVAAGLAIAACLGIAYTIGQQHYDAPARYTAAVSTQAPLPPVEEGRTDQPRAGGEVVLGTELRRLESLGYQGPPAGDAKSTDYADENRGEVSYGYQVPNGVEPSQPSENLNAKMWAMADGSPYRRSVVGGRGAFKPQDAAGREPAGGSAGGFAVEKTPPPATPPLPEAAGGTGGGDYGYYAKYGQAQANTPSNRGDGEAYLIRGRGANVIAPGVTVSRLDNSVLRPDRNSDGVADEGVLVGDGVVSFTGGGGSNAVDYAYVATAAKPSDNYYLPAHEVPGSGAQANTLQSGAAGDRKMVTLDHADSDAVKEQLSQIVAMSSSPTLSRSEYSVPLEPARTVAPDADSHVYIAAKYSTAEDFSAGLRDFVKQENDRLSTLDDQSSKDAPAVAASGSNPANAPAQPGPTEPGPAKPQAAPDVTPAPAPTSQLVAQPRPKIIKTGELGVEVPEYAPAYSQVQAIVARFHAFVADVNSQEGPGGAVTSKVTIRVVPEEFEALFGALKAVGRVESENVKAADVTAQYVDLEARIKASQINEERLQELVKSKSIIDKMASLLEVERELARVRTEIEQMQGQLRVMADHIGLSTLAITLREPARVVPSAALSVEVPVLADAADALGKALEERGGRLTSGKISRRKDGTFQGDYQLEVTLDHFDDVLHAIEGLGRVEDRQVKDRRYSDATAVWAAKVKCPLALVLYESARELPKGEAAVEVDALAPALTRLSDLLKAHSGTIAANRTSQRDDGSSLADLKLAVPAGNFAAFAATLDTLGRVTARQLSGEAGRVVGGAADVMCDVALRLAERPRQIPSGNMTIEVEKFETARQQISALVAQKGVQVLASGSAKRSDGTTTGQFRLGIKAADMETVVGRLESLGRVDARAIAGLGLGDLSTIDPSTVGVIDLSLHEKAAISPDPSRAGDSIRAHFTDGLAGLYRSAGLIVYGLMTMVPWVLVTGAALWIIARVFRKRPTAAAPVKP